jgi:gas vesicle protein
MNTTTKIIGGFLAGAALGVATGLLMAPDSGKRTRKKIMDKSKEVGDQVAKSVAKTLENVKSTYNQKVDEFAKTGKASLEAMKEKVKA